MRKRGKRDSYICSCTPGGARGTTTVTVPKRKSGKRTAVPLSWEVLEHRNPTRHAWGWVDMSRRRLCTLASPLPLPGPVYIHCRPRSRLSSTPPDCCSPAPIRRPHWSTNTCQPGDCLLEYRGPRLTVRLVPPLTCNSEHPSVTRPVPVCVCVWCVYMGVCACNTDTTCGADGGCARKAAGTVAVVGGPRVGRCPLPVCRSVERGVARSCRLLLRVLCTVVVE